jgi:hypothetical protein
VSAPHAPWRRPRALEWVAAGIALYGVVMLVLPVSARARVRPTVVPDVAATPDVPLSADSATSILVATNLFSGSRRAPRERFRVPGLAADDVPTTAMLDSTSTSSVATGPQLYGIVSLDGQTRALVQIASDSTPRLVAEGARLGSWRVGRIGADRIELLSSSGTRIVRLSRRSTPDSAEPPQ